MTCATAKITGAPVAQITLFQAAPLLNLPIVKTERRTERATALLLWSAEQQAQFFPTGKFGALAQSLIGDPS